MEKLKYKPKGFMANSTYSAYFPGIFKKYEDQFGDAESIEVELDEIPYTWIGKSQNEPITISEDGKKITVYYSDWKEYDKKGKEKSKPTPKSVFDSIERLMDRAVIEYGEKFPPNKTEPEQEQK